MSNTRGVMNFTCGTDIRGGKLADEGASGEQVRQVQVSSIDEMVHEEGRPCPCYLKVDVEDKWMTKFGALWAVRA